MWIPDPYLSQCLRCFPGAKCWESSSNNHSAASLTETGWSSFPQATLPKTARFLTTGRLGYTWYKSCLCTHTGRKFEAERFRRVQDPYPLWRCCDPESTSGGVQISDKDDIYPVQESRNSMRININWCINIKIRMDTPHFLRILPTDQQ
jgi:hypothetical protein